MQPIFRLDSSRGSSLEQTVTKMVNNINGFNNNEYSSRIKLKTSSQKKIKET